MSVKSAGNKKKYSQSEILSKATITDIVSLSSTVKSLTLKIEDPAVTFKAGQWVDFFIPGMKVFTGFSMTSAPRQLTEERTLQLAVKRTGYAPTLWVHEQAHPGNEVTVRVAGDFSYDPQLGDNSTDLLLVAGGVGINPLCSMMRHMADLKRQGQNAYQPGQVEMLYTARSCDELIFKDDLEKLCQENSNMNCRLFATQEESSSSNSIVYGRIDQDALSKVLQKYSPERLPKLMCFICGPSKMIDAIEALLLKLNILEHQIKYEKWW
ncbi:Oxidoreductase NAD-binding domain-containing protein 1 [Lamellibrachia satsuma]|nr:Oxidoreductase NAD-binding domain-containing protein 1 [Lamellibrachia satsuma]